MRRREKTNQLAVWGTQLMPATMQNTNGSRPRAGGKFDHDRILTVHLGSLTPAVVNEQVYRPVDPADPDAKALATSIREHGVKEPLVVTLDDVILSGHRRYAAAVLAGLETVPCRRENVCSTDPEFLPLLVEYN